MRSRLTRLLILLIACSVSIQAYGQHRLSGGLRGGYPFSSQKEFLGGVNSLEMPLKASMSADFQYAFVFPEVSYQGIGISVFSMFDHKDLGTPVSLYVFQGARIAQLTPELSLDYEWNFGASFGWHRYKEHPLNTITGTKVNAYVNGAIMLTWHPFDDLKISFGPEFTHFSNGHTELPNAGLNTVGMRLNAVKIYEGDTFAAFARSYKEADRSGHFSLDLTVFGALKKSGIKHNDMFYAAEGRFLTAGVHINPFYDFHKHFRAGLSLDLNYDESANIGSHLVGSSADVAIGFYQPDLNEQMSAGLSVRAELVMPIFSIHFGVGHNIIYKGTDLAGLYQIIALKTHIIKGLYLHTGYQFRDFHRPDHLLLGLGYRFGRY